MHLYIMDPGFTEDFNNLPNWIFGTFWPFGDLSDGFLSSFSPIQFIGGYEQVIGHFLDVRIQESPVFGDLHNPHKGFPGPFNDLDNFPFDTFSTSAGVQVDLHIIPVQGMVKVVA